MMQLYFLSLCVNLICGLALIFGDSTDPKYSFFNFAKNTRFKLCIGLISVVVSFITLFSSYSGSMVFFGDLIPSLTGLLAGTTFLYGFYLDKRTLPTEEKEKKFETFFMANKKYFGVTCLVAALLHFIFPKVVVL